MIQARILKHQIYIYCPANFVTGGTELLHQLVDVLRNNGAEAYIYYIGEPDAAIPDAFKRYNIQQSWKLSIEKTILSYCQKHCLNII